LVFDRRQIKIYSKALKAQENKFQFIYSHTSIYGKSYMRSDGNYVFSGGNTNRDYETLIEASRELPYQFLIVTTEADQLLNRLDIPKNVTLKCRISEDEFNQLIAKASVVVVPLKGGLIESGGRLVYLNAMTLGKPVVVADDNGALDYIRNGTDGFVVKSGDIAELRKSIDLLMRNRKLASVIGNNAEKSAVAFSPEAFFKEIFAFVDNIHLP
jgi:glycosyltransferase involved in cell wall biosynthesis